MKLKSRERYMSMSSAERKLKYGRKGTKNGNWRNGGKSYKICPICNINKIASTSSTCGSCRIRTGENNSFYNKHHTKETKQLIREKNSGNNSWIKNIDPIKLPYTKKYEITYQNNTIKQVYGLKTIAKEFNTSITNVHNVINRIKNGINPKRGVFANIIIKEVL